MKKRDLSTKELALYLHVTVEEAKNIKSLPDTEKSIESKVADAPASEDPDDPNAWYCRNKTDGAQYRMEVNGQNYCLLQKQCRCQAQSEHKAKKCTYKGR